MPGKEIPKARRSRFCIVGVGLRVDARKQRGRQAALARAFGLIHPRAGDKHVEVGLERLLNCILQREPVGRRLLRRRRLRSGQTCEQACQR